VPDRVRTSGTPTVSVVINTLDRATELAQTLRALRRIRYAGEFEVVVVNGPSTDGTAALLEEWGEDLVLGSVDVRNLSVSRNAGIRLAAGEIVAFLDDDAIPEPEWLTELVAAYDSPAVGAAGGFVLDHTGHAFQYTYGSVDRFGVAETHLEAPCPERCYPASWKIPHLMGTNASYRRTALEEIGGYDEFYEYFLDESDVQVRLADAGYLIAQTSRARVHHHFAPSHVRNAARVPRDRYPILKNKLYFALRHANDFVSIDEILRMFHAYVDHHREDVRWQVEHGNLVEADRARLEADAQRATEDGLRGALSSTGPTPTDVSRHRDELRSFDTLSRQDPRCFVLVSQELPPESFGGIGTYTRDLASGLAAAGHDVHVLTRSADFDRVDWDDGVWVHRLVVADDERSADAGSVPAHIWAWSRACLAEVARIDDVTPVDLVEAPLWDAQGIALVRDGRWPVVVALQTSLAVWLDSHESLASDEEWMAGFGRPVLAAEKEVLERSAAVRGISRAIVETIAVRHGLDLGGRSQVTALGVAAPRLLDAERHVARVEREVGRVNVLFVGRLEERKAPDVLLRAFAKAWEREPSLALHVVGDDTIVWPAHGTTLRRWYETELGDDPSARAVRFLGSVSEHQLALAYGNSDVFVAPSRYESFGLVFVEAMMRGLPVVGTDVGGVPEVVRDGVDGLLVPADDVDALADALVRLGQDATLRSRFGANGADHYAAEFTTEAMADRTERFYDHVLTAGVPLR